MAGAGSAWQAKGVLFRGRRRRSRLGHHRGALVVPPRHLRLGERLGRRRLPGLVAEVIVALLRLHARAHDGLALFMSWRLGGGWRRGRRLCGGRLVRLVVVFLRQGGAGEEGGGDRRHKEGAHGLQLQLSPQPGPPRSLRIEMHQLFGGPLAGRATLTTGRKRY